jgi:hypothetical protein
MRAMVETTVVAGDRPGGRARTLIENPSVLLLASSCIGSALAGVVVGGVGGRLVMRVSAIAADDSRLGLITDNGNEIGRISGDGTLALMTFVGLAAGLATGLFLAALRTVLPRRLLPLWVSVAMLALFSPAVIDHANPDFTIVGNRVLNVAMFAALFPAFGCSAIWIAERFERWLVVPPLVRLAPISLLGAGFGLLAGVAGLAVLAGVAGPLGAAVVVVVTAGGVAAAVGGRALARPARGAALAALAVGVIAGTIGLVDDVLTIAG